MPTTETIPTTARNADLADLAEILKTQQAVKTDLVVPAIAMRFHHATLCLRGQEQVLAESGVIDPNGDYRPTVVFDEGAAEKLTIPVAYLKRLRAERPDIYDVNVNRWLRGNAIRNAEPDPRSFLLRLFRSANGDDGVARAMLSPNYRIVDNLDVLTAALEGIAAAGVNVAIDGCDLTERRMRVRIVSEDVKALAPMLLRNYRSPFDQGVQRAGFRDLDHLRDVADREGMGYGAGEEPVVFGGFEISNSETGGGAWTMTPRLVVKVCRNGLTINVDAMRSIHLGSRMDDGVVRWSSETEERNLALVSSQTRDAVTTFMDHEYVARKVAEIEEAAGVRVAIPTDTIQHVGSTLRFSAERTETILNHFILGGQMTAGGVLQAITSVAQTVDDGDEAALLEGSAVRALELAAAFG